MGKLFERGFEVWVSSQKESFKRKNKTKKIFSVFFSAHIFAQNFLYHNIPRGQARNNGEMPRGNGTREDKDEIRKEDG